MVWTVYISGLQDDIRAVSQEAEPHHAENERWAEKCFAYNYLTLVSREAYEEAHGWDTFIPIAYERL
jgi:hypothetical protein